ncbi:MULTISPECIES: VacJ family lipoprotein [unclassified Caulobacter]|uniref:MlaA family lipoprotein n=1 Tax=unclassified Caulobacter TaxID=2648921 RepID=UPI000781EB34|nr:MULTISPECIES: MlaA family lipoprotein [unclassified Caulobacter]AZS23211.1 VacJ family lipoprotein [Caulobacter sp. FWC26]
MAPMRSRSIRLRDQHDSPGLQPLGRRLAAGGLAAVCGLSIATGALAQTDASPSALAAEAANDPLEGLNRASFKLGMGLDRAFLGPIAHGYMAVTPRVVRDRVSSAIYNLGEPNTVMNQVLQGKPRRAVRSSTRFVVNSTIGVLGLFDVAAKMGLPPRGADFGQTFGRWGAGPGAYIYVPLMGPLNVRDGVGRALDIVTDPVSMVAGGFDTDFGKARTVVTVVDLRAATDSGFRALKDAADPYVTTRSAYGQYREAFVREATGETETLPDFDAPPSEPTTPSPPTP